MTNEGLLACASKHDSFGCSHFLGSGNAVISYMSLVSFYRIWVQWKVVPTTFYQCHIFNRTFHIAYVKKVFKLLEVTRGSLPNIWLYKPTKRTINIQILRLYWVSLKMKILFQQSSVFDAITMCNISFEFWIPFKINKYLKSLAYCVGILEGLAQRKSNEHAC